MKKPEVLSTEIVHKNPWWHVHKDELRWPDGKKYIYYVAEHGSSAIVVCERGGKILIREQYRYCIDQSTIEFPGGTLEPNESPMDGARRELLEETGYQASLTEIGDFYANSGHSYLHIFIFVANNPVHIREQHLDAWEMETSIGEHWIELADIEKQIQTGKIKNLETLGTWTLYRGWTTTRRSLSSPDL